MELPRGTLRSPVPVPSRFCNLNQLQKRARTQWHTISWEKSHMPLDLTTSPTIFRDSEPYGSSQVFNMQPWTFPPRNPGISSVPNGEELWLAVSAKQHPWLDLDHLMRYCQLRLYRERREVIKSSKTSSYKIWRTARVYEFSSKLGTTIWAADSPSFSRPYWLSSGGSQSEASKRDQAAELTECPQHIKASEIIPASHFSKTVLLFRKSGVTDATQVDTTSATSNWSVVS